MICNTSAGIQSRQAFRIRDVIHGIGVEKGIERLGRPGNGG
jgi:hypothetical protein